MFSPEERSACRQPLEAEEGEALDTIGDDTLYYTLASPLYRNARSDHWLIYDKGIKNARRRNFWIDYFNNETMNSATMEMRPWCTRTSFKNITILRKRNFKIYLKSSFFTDDLNLESIKTRGVLYSLQELTDRQKENGVIAISTGNFAYPLCYFGKEFNIPVTIVMPQDVEEEKKQMCKNLGAKVESNGINNMIEAHNTALRIAREGRMFYLDGNDHPYMITGQATLAVEIYEEITSRKKIDGKRIRIDVVILPTTIDGCGLTACLAMFLKNWSEKLIIIEARTEKQCPLIQDVRSQHKFPQTNIHGPECFIGQMDTSDKGLPHCWIDHCMTVSDANVQRAVSLLRERENIVDSHAAIGLAALLDVQLMNLLRKKLAHLKIKRVLIPMFGRMDSPMDLTNRPGPAREHN
ncbi:L-threonine dehydratase catabolic TdcB [Solenopsis invicta]|uniref:L-threonine dehydratase catabolic TdcB n=1 Tax=Solenopsis invicta TaxID=13686 RepID=UPI000596181C|nr:L-threonine dehydratase catabolic TdcB [Solenopsis invicta]